MKKKIVIETKYTAKGADKVEDAYEGIGESAEKAAGSVDKTNTAMEGTGKASEGAKKGLGGVLDGFKAIVMNPIGLVLTALVGAFLFIKDAISESEEASNALSQGFAFLGGIIQPLKDLVVGSFMAIVSAIKEPGKAWDSFVTGFENSVNYVNDNILQPYLSTWKLLGLGVIKQITNMRLAWNEFTGDVEESDELQTKLDGINEAIADNQKVITDAANTIKEDVKGAYEAVVETVSEYVVVATKAANVAVELEKREQNLLKVRREQEVQNANSLANLEILKNIRDDESQSLEDRIKANNELAIVEKARIDAAISLAQAELQLTRDIIKVKGSSTELLDAEKDKEIELAELRGENAGIQNEQITNAVGLKKEAFEKEVALIDQKRELDAILEEDAVKLADAVVKAEEDKLIKLQELGLQENQIFRDTQNALALSQQEAIKARQDADAQAAIKKKEQDQLDAEKKVFDDKVANADALIDLADQLSNTISDIKMTSINQEQSALDSALENGLISEEEYNKETERLAKEAATVQRNATLIKLAVDTASAISSLVASSTANPLNSATFGTAGIIQFAAGMVGIAANMATASALLKAPAPNVGSGSGGGSSQAPNTKQTQPNLGFDGQSAGSEQFGAQVIKAYVTESDITTSQTNASNIQELSQIG